ncbi:MAG: CpsD/CapB family tyrosine-protein kinase [Oscillospiraceae bacterium]|nr:CpsD/CapB family tyrosine-protein kinase [Oscillospiraceae bacterium]
MKPQNEQEQNGGYMVQRRRILSKHTNFAIQEAYKRLRTNLNFSVRGKKCKRFCITSAGAGEGKSITLLNLAISIAQTNKRVLLIDADMRRPAVARLLVEQASPGLSEVLCEEISAKDAIRKEVYPNLDILYSGEIPPNPSELLGSECMEQLVNEMEQEYDYILIDTPPVGVVTDACLVATLLDGVLLLVWQNRTRKDNIKAAVESLQLAGANILGYVMNGVEIETKKYYYSNY